MRVPTGDFLAEATERIVSLFFIIKVVLFVCENNIQTKARYAALRTN
jgi:hypothetical protein